MPFERPLVPLAKFVSASAMLCLCSAGASAAPTTPPLAPAVPKVGGKPVAQPAPKGATEDKDLILAPGDSIAVSVVGHTELSLAVVTISAAGQISHPLGGLIKVGGQSLAGASEAVAKALRDYFNDPVVAVTLVKARPRTILVSGAVKTPGTLTIKKSWRVTEAIAAAGGLAGTPATVGITLLRPGQAARRINVLDIVSNPTSSSNVYLVPGDVLRFEIQNISITIKGQVAKPGLVYLRKGTHLSEALRVMGGTLPRAALSKASLERFDGTVLSLNLVQVGPDGPVVFDPELKNGDVLVVPENQAQVRVTGDVARPTVIDLPDGKTLRLAEALAQAGGLTLPPGSARITVGRTLPGGRFIPISIDAVALLVNADASQNAVLRDGDLITVSPLKNRTIFMMGEVKSPGPIQAKDNEGLPELLARAGGVTPDAALRQVTVTRQGNVVSTVDLFEVVKGGASVLVALQDGDTITVPRNQARVLVISAVRNPGVYSIPEDKPLSVSDALRLAGGPIHLALLSEVVILRRASTGVQSQIVPLSDATLLQSGDVVYVPEGKADPNVIERALRAASLFRF